MDAERCRELATELAEKVGDWFNCERHDPSGLVPHVEEVLRRAVAEEAEACAGVAEGVVGTFEVAQSPLGIQGRIARRIRERWQP